MFTANLWVRGPQDVNWRLNASFHRPDMFSAVERVNEEIMWYAKHGYRYWAGPEAPETDVPE